MAPWRCKLLLLPLLLTLPNQVCALAITDNNSKNILKLQVPHPERTPAELLRSLADTCDSLGVEAWDVYGDFDRDAACSYLKRFEQEIATEFGKPDAVFMPSGVMAQSIALLIHNSKKPTGKFACHWTSHLLLHEQEGFQYLCGMKPTALGAATHFPAHPLLYSDIQSCSSDVRDSSCLLLELPHRECGGKLTPWQDVEKLQSYCQDNGIAFHCDGARIFEASAGYDKSLAELARPFDSVYISFYKGLGGMSGAMLMGSVEFCEEARVWLRRFGGNLYTLLPYAVSGWTGYQRYWKVPQQDKSIMSFVDKRDKLVRIVQALSTDKACSKVIALDPPIPEVNMVHCYLRPSLEDCQRVRDSIQALLGISIFHRLRALTSDEPAFKSGYRAKLELSLGEANGSISDDAFVQGWTEFCKDISMTMSK
jgi:threonine aldolase